MKIAIALVLSLLVGPATAQTWQCFSGSVPCAPGSPSCNCTQTLATTSLPPAVPACPAMTFWNGITCQVPAAPAVDMSAYLLQQQLLQQQMQQQRMIEWQHEQWHQQHPGGPGH
jgi:hypothetical protein